MEQIFPLHGGYIENEIAAKYCYSRTSVHIPIVKFNADDVS